VKSADLHTMTRNKGINTLAHLTRGLVGKGDRKDALGANAILHQLGYPAGDNPGFSTACPCENQQWTIPMQHSLLLGMV
jgi:hypothetical protein